MTRNSLYERLPTSDIFLRHSLKIKENPCNKHMRDTCHTRVTHHAQAESLVQAYGSRDMESYTDTWHAHDTYHARDKSLVQAVYHGYRYIYESH